MAARPRRDVDVGTLLERKTELGGQVQLLLADDCWRDRGAADSAVDLTLERSTIRRTGSSSVRVRVTSTRGFRALYVDGRRRLRGGRRGRELDRARGGANYPSRPSTRVQRDRPGPRFAVTSDCRGRHRLRVGEGATVSRSHRAVGAPFVGGRWPACVGRAALARNQSRADLRKQRNPESPQFAGISGHP